MGTDPGTRDFKTRRSTVGHQKEDANEEPSNSERPPTKCANALFNDRIYRSDGAYDKQNGEFSKMAKIEMNKRRFLRKYQKE